MDDIQTLIDKHQSIIATTPTLMKMISHTANAVESKDESWREMQNIRVITRFRPINRVEIDHCKLHNIQDIAPIINGNTVTLTQITNNTITAQKEATQFESVLDHIFNTKATQKQLFTKLGQPLIEASLGGFNATLFAYGQTGSGKTYSIFGANDDGSGSDPQSMGIIPRSFAYIFERLDQQCNNGSIADYTVSIQLLQIYNKQLLDLLNAQAGVKLEIKTDFNTNTLYVQHLTKYEITSAQQALACIIEGSKNRIVASHKLNAHSSRSHMLVLMKVKQSKADGTSINSNINFGDLAGSENIAKAHGKEKGRDEDEINTANERLKEGIAINASLSALTRCIHLLVKGQRPTYRESPLTYLLQDSLGGNSKTTLLVCASPHIYNRTETISTLRFAATAKAVKNKAKINLNLSVKALKKRIKELEAENKRLKKKLNKEKKEVKHEPFKHILGKRVSTYFAGETKDDNKLKKSSNKEKKKRVRVKENKGKAKYKKKMKSKYKKNDLSMSKSTQHKDGKIEEKKSFWDQLFSCESPFECCQQY